MLCADITESRWKSRLTSYFGPAAHKLPVLVLIGKQTAATATADDSRPFAKSSTSWQEDGRWGRSTLYPLGAPNYTLQIYSVAKDFNVLSHKQYEWYMSKTHIPNPRHHVQDLQRMNPSCCCGSHLFGLAESIISKCECCSIWLDSRWLDFVSLTNEEHLLSTSHGLAWRSVSDSSIATLHVLKSV